LPTYENPITDFPPKFCSDKLSGSKYARLTIVGFGINLIFPSLLPCFKENRVLQQPSPQQPTSKPHRATLGFAFSIAGAILILKKSQQESFWL
jgi:hypothetical protein